MNLRLIFILIIGLLSAHSETVFARGKLSPCEVAKNEFENAFIELQNEYKTVYNESVASENQPTWTWGHGERKKQIVYLLHGFIGTPEEMRVTADLLVKNGFTVVNDLIPGHGVSGFTSNKYNETKWRSHVSSQFFRLRQCTDQIFVIGFSTGALLIHDYLIQNQKDFSPKGVIFFSPFYKPNLSFVSWLQKAIRLFSTTVPVDFLYSFLHFPDVRVATLKRNNYMQSIPLDTASAIQRLGQMVFDESAMDSEVPALLFASEDDQVIKYNDTVAKMQNDFKKLYLVNFDRDAVPHHLMVKEVSSVAPRVQSKTLDFILSLAN